MIIADLEPMIVALVAGAPTLAHLRSEVSPGILPCREREYTVVGHYSVFERVAAARLFQPGREFVYHASGLIQPGDLDFIILVYVEDGYFDCIEVVVFEGEFPERFASAELAHGLNGFFKRLHPEASDGGGSS